MNKILIASNDFKYYSSELLFRPDLFSLKN